MPPFVVDNSMFESTVCSLKVWLRYVQHYTTKEERAELLSGTAVHAGMAKHAEGKSVHECLGHFNMVYQDWAMSNVEPDSRLSYLAYHDIFKQWLETHQDGSLPYKYVPGFVEMGFQVPLDENGDFLFVGRVDAGVEYEGEFTIKETKTTGSLTEPWKNKWHLASQGTGYVYGCRNGIKGMEKVDGFIVEALDFHKLPQETEKKCYKHQLKYKECRLLHSNHWLSGKFVRNEDQLHEWRRNALRLAFYIKKLAEQYPELYYVQQLPQEGMFRNACQFCEFAPICRTPRIPAHVQGTLLYSPWNPLDMQTVKK